MTPRKKKAGIAKKMAEEANNQTAAKAVEDEALLGNPALAEDEVPLPPGVKSAEVGAMNQSHPESESKSVNPEITESTDTENLIEQLREQRLRALAESDNIRKRAEVEIANVRKFALEGFARELLNVKDSLELARAVDLESSDGYSEISAKVMEGLDLTIKQLEAVFGQYSIDAVNPKPGDKLDPDRHQAMSMEETAEIEPNRICRVVQRGYLLHGRLLRPAMVIVAKEPNDA